MGDGNSDDTRPSFTVGNKKITPPKAMRSASLAGTIVIVSSLVFTLLLHFSVYSSFMLGPPADEGYEPVTLLTLDKDFELIGESDTQAVYAMDYNPNVFDDSFNATFKIPRGKGNKDSWQAFFGFRVDKDVKPIGKDDHTIMDLPFGYRFQTYPSRAQYCWQVKGGDGGTWDKVELQHEESTGEKIKVDDTCRRCDACDEDGCQYYITVGNFINPLEQKYVTRNSDDKKNKIVVVVETSFHEWCPISFILWSTLFVLPAAGAVLHFFGLVYIYGRASQVGLLKWRVDRPVGRFLSFYIGTGVGFIVGPFAWILECVCNDGSRLFVSGMLFGHFLLGCFLSTAIMAFLYFTRLYELLLPALIANIACMSFAMITAAGSFDCMYQIDYKVTRHLFSPKQKDVAMQDVQDFGEIDGDIDSDLDMDLEMIDDDVGADARLANINISTNTTTTTTTSTTTAAATTSTSTPAAAAAASAAAVPAATSSNGGVGNLLDLDIPANDTTTTAAAAAAATTTTTSGSGSGTDVVGDLISMDVGSGNGQS